MVQSLDFQLYALALDCSRLDNLPEAPHSGWIFGVPICFYYNVLNSGFSLFTSLGFCVLDFSFCLSIGVFFFFFFLLLFLCNYLYSYWILSAWVWSLRKIMADVMGAAFQDLVTRCMTTFVNLDIRQTKGPLCYLRPGSRTFFCRTFSRNAETHSLSTDGYAYFSFTI